MTVYIEYVLIDNFFIDYILLESAFALLGKKEKRKRLFLCAFVFSVFALVMPLITVSSVILAAIKITTMLLCVSVCFKFTSKKEYIYFIFLFLLLTFTAIGAIMGIFGMLGIEYSGEISIALMGLPVYVVVRVSVKIIKFTKFRYSAKKCYYKVKLVSGEKEIFTTGFLDTGNHAFDGDSPLIFCDRKVAARLMGNPPPKIKHVTVSSVGGEISLLSFKLTKIEIYYKDEPNIYYNVTLCACKNAGFGCEVILHPALGGNYETDKVAEKTS